MAWLPPVGIPSLQGRDYSRELYGMTSGIGDALYQNRRDAVGDDQWQKNFAHALQQDALQQSNADRNYALALRKFEADHALALRKMEMDEAEAMAGGNESWYGNAYDVELPGGGLGKAIISNRGNTRLLDVPGGGGMPVPAGPGAGPGSESASTQVAGGRWLPPASTADAGNQIIIKDKFGRVIGSIPKGGTPPPGYVPQIEPDGTVSMAPGSGTPQELEANQKRSGAQQALLSGQQQAETIFKTIDAIGDSLDSGWATGIGGRIGAGFNWATGTPTERSRVDAAIETIRALTSRDALISMRLESPTGAAVGNVSDFENRLMAATAGVLDPDRDPEGTKRTLADIRDKWEDFMVAREIAYLANFEGLPANVAYEALDAIRAGKDPQAVLARIKELGAR